MAEINIPVEHQSKIEFYLNLPEEVKSKLIEKIKSSPIGLTPPSFAEFLSAEVPIAKEKISDILQVAFSLLNAKDAIGIDLDGFIEILRRALSRTENENLFPKETILNDFKTLLSANGSNAFATAKILDLMTEQSRVYLDSKVTNDIRPILGDNNVIIGSIIIHQLKLTFREGEETKETYFALDTNDLTKLIDKLNQAEVQSNIIKEHFSNSTFINIT